ncbi:MAG: hypothetical protein PHE32_01855 [Candidatus Shapirobacteria bacterium]|nr:hypothetical protein [Candidatus Shapirobacteria bacterium]MDD4410419.1 hypothetical protein [Candidatus Shapirobacteria bacterium]
MEKNKKPDYIGNTIVFVLFGFLLYAGYLSYKSIDWTILKRLEAEPLVLPTPIPATQSAQIAPSATPSSSIKK